MIHFAQNNDIIIGVDFGYGNDIAVKTTAKVHEDGRLEILKSEQLGRTRDITQELRDRMIAEYVELDERTNKLDEFILKNPKFNEIPSEQKPLMYAQMNAMDDYRQNLRARMSLLGITNDDIAAYKHPYQNLSFGEALQALEAGKCVRRENWEEGKFVVKQIPADIPAEVVPNMQSLPDSAKEIINKTHREDIHYRCQCLLIVQDTETSVATNYIPDWQDMFAKNWMIV